MILYNVTIQLDPSISDAWLAWMKEEHIPEVMSTGLFTEAKCWQLLDHQEGAGVTYAVQYLSPDRAMYQQYIDEHAPILRKKGMDKWGDRFIAFRTAMQQVI
jgi:hypothetical protein